MPETPCPAAAGSRLRAYADGDTVVAEVADTGHGIRREDVKRIYDPFFTTKGVGRGTGLGLAVSYGILQEHGGAVFVESTPGQGTTFPGGAASGANSGGGAPMNPESILVVDDEEVMRDVLQRLLTEAGYQVTLAESAEQCLSLVRRGGFDAAILDLMLPGVSGLDLLDDIRRTDPELVVLMITAFASIETAITAMKKGAFDYITKPFKNDELLHVLRNGLNQRRLVDENRQLRTALRDQGRFTDIVGKSPRMQQVFNLIAQAAPSRSTILVVGRERHGQGARRQGRPRQQPYGATSLSSSSTQGRCPMSCSRATFSAT